MATKRIIIDVREPTEYIAGHVKGAINIPPAEFLSGALELADVPKNTELILYCQSGRRAGLAQRILTAQGFTNVINAINQQNVTAKYPSE